MRSFSPTDPFGIGTYTGDDGAPVGSYRVTIIWPTITAEGGEEIAGRDRLQGVLSDSNQPVAKIEVQAGENTLPIWDLKVGFQP